MRFGCLYEHQRVKMCRVIMIHCFDTTVCSMNIFCSHTVNCITTSTRRLGARLDSTFNTVKCVSRNLNTTFFALPVQLTACMFDACTEELIYLRVPYFVYRPISTTAYLNSLQQCSSFPNSQCVLYSLPTTQLFRTYDLVIQQFARVNCPFLESRETT